MNPNIHRKQGNSSSQRMDNVVGNVSIQGNSSSFTFAPVQIGTQVQTQIIQISAERITQQELNKSSPYKGLKRYNFSDREYFFGRDALIARLFEAVNQNTFLLVAGASGCGKSSVVRAGLIPELKSNLGATKLLDFIFTPGRNPFESFYRCLLADDKDYSFTEDEAELARVSNPQTIVDVIQSLKQDNDRWLILIDQFEEIFTNCSDEQVRRDFIDSLVQLSQHSDESIRVILAMRADFLEYFSAYPQLGIIANNNNIHLVTAMHPDELRQTIEQPAAKHGVVFEKGLVTRIIQEVQGQSGYLPLLQYTLNLLWETECISIGRDGRPHIEDRILNLSIYSALEGVRGALQARISKLYQQLSQDEQAATRQIFLRLVQIVDTDSGSRAVSRKAYRSEFQGEIIETTLRKFVNENMIVSGYEYSGKDKVLIGSSINTARNATFEIAHEIILSSWDALKKWLQEAKDAIIFKNLLADDVHRWYSALNQGNPNDSKESDRAKDELLKGSRLDRAIELRQSNSFELLGGLTDLENQFIDASLEWLYLQRRRKVELETEKERNELLTTANQKAKRVIRRGMITLAVIIPVSIGASLVAFQAFRDFSVARTGTKLEQAGVSALRQMRSGEIDALLSALHAAYGLQNLVDENTPLEKYPAVSPILALQKIVDSIHEKNRFDTGQGEIKATAFNRAGNRIITAGRDGTIQIWRPSGEKIYQFKAHAGGLLASINSASFSPDDQHIATASSDGTAKIWSVSGKLLTNLEGHQGAVNYVAFSPDGASVATAGSDGEVLLWDISGNKLFQLDRHQGNVLEVVFSPDGEKLATASSDGQIRVWNTSGDQLSQWEGHGSKPVYSVNFSPDGQKLISAGGDNNAKVWNLSGQQYLILEGHRRSVTDASFMFNGERLITASDDGTAKLWNLEGEEIAHFQGHRGGIWNTVFSPDGEYVCTSGKDGTVRLWSFKNEPFLEYFGLKDDVNAVSFSPDGKYYAAGGNEGIVGIWQASERPLKSWRAVHRGYIFSIAFSPDSRFIATGSSDASVSIWDLSGNREKIRRGFGSSISSLAFSPDGQFLLIGPTNGLVRLWRLDRDEGIALEGLNKISAVAFSPDSSMIAAANWEGLISLWDRSGKLIKQWHGHDTTVSDLDFNSDGKLIASADKDGNIRLWNTLGQLRLDFFSYQSGINALNIIPNSSLISTGGMDGTVRIWDLSGRQIYEYNLSKGPVWGLAASPNGDMILGGGDAGEMRLWMTEELSTIISKSCTWLKEYLENSNTKERQYICPSI